MHHHTPATGGEERERHRANQVYALTTHQLQVERERENHRANQVYALPHTSYRWRGGENHRANQVYALTTHQLQVERRERDIETIKCMLSPHTSYMWRGERVIEPIKCSAHHTQLQVERRESHRDNQVYALTTAHHLAR